MRIFNPNQTGGGGEPFPNKSALKSRGVLKKPKGFYSQTPNHLSYEYPKTCGVQKINENMHGCILLIL